MTNRQNLPWKKVKCPECNREMSSLDMLPHGMWEFGTAKHIEFACIFCEYVFLRVERRLSTTHEGVPFLSDYFSTGGV